MNAVMVITELDDGREHIHTKQNKPEKYNLNDKSDLALISNYKAVFIEKKLMCYNKDLTIMAHPSYLKVNDRVYAKSFRFEPYKDIFIKKRTFAIWQ
jgi:hypothetical protein|tara:strand:- start:578 stop:868 length:291 start_codon:yes stop_codon:yes gene_type:complete